jgi:hypothetical protein
MGEKGTAMPMNRIGAKKVDRINAKELDNLSKLFSTPKL